MIDRDTFFYYNEANVKGFNGLTLLNCNCYVSDLTFLLYFGVTCVTLVRIVNFNFTEM